jgi:hypothetical protein
MQVIWLASYPRSGNTWLRFLLHNYIYGQVRESGDVNKSIPPIHRYQLNAGYQGTILSKTHYAWSGSHPHRAQTLGFIYILRNPKDVLLSSHNYAALKGTTELNAEKFAQEFIRCGGVPAWQRQGFGTWMEHIAGWLADQRLPHLVLRYETMLENPQVCLRDLVRFLNLQIDEDRIARSVERSSFESLKKIERQEKESGVRNILFPGSKDQAAKGVSFMHKGARGRSLAHIDPQLDQLFDRQFTPFMRRADDLLTAYDRRAQQQQSIASGLVLHDWHDRKVLGPARHEAKASSRDCPQLHLASREISPHVHRQRVPGPSPAPIDSSGAPARYGSLPACSGNAAAPTQPGPSQPASCLINSLPSSGARVFENALSLFPGISPGRMPLVHATVARLAAGHAAETPSIPIGVDWPLSTPRAAVRDYLKSLDRGTCAISHVPFSEELGSLLDEAQIKTFLLLRDPRDVVVQHAGFLSRSRSHFLHPVYSALSPAERLMSSIAGLPPAAPDAPQLVNINMRYRSVLGWASQGCNATIFFEQLLGARNGGSCSPLHHALGRVAAHLNLVCSPQDISRIAEKMQPVLARNSVGAWRTAFLPEHKRLFKDIAGQLLIDLGYEKHYDW